MWQIPRTVRGALLAYRLPAIISYFVVVCVCVFDLGKKVYVYWKSKQVTFAGIMQSYHIMYGSCVCLYVCSPIWSLLWDTDAGPGPTFGINGPRQCECDPGPSRGGKGESFPGPRDVWGSRRRSKILKMVFQMASFWPKICIKSIRGSAPTPLVELF